MKPLLLFLRADVPLKWENGEEKEKRYGEIRPTGMGVDEAMTEQCIIAASFHYFEPLSDSFSIKSNRGGTSRDGASSGPQSL